MKAFLNVQLILFLLLLGCSQQTKNFKTDQDLSSIHESLNTRLHEAEIEYKDKCTKMDISRQKMKDLSNRINDALDKEISEQKLNPENKYLFDSIKPIAEEAKEREISCRSAQSKYSTILEHNYEYFKNHNPPESQPALPSLPPPVQCFSTRVGNSVSTTCY